MCFNQLVFEFEDKDMLAFPHNITIFSSIGEERDE